MGPRLRRVRASWSAALLIGLALPVLAGCPRPSVPGPVGQTQSSQVAALETTLAGDPDPLRIGSSNQGRSGPPPLGLIERPPRSSSSETSVVRPTPEVPLRKPETALTAADTVGEDRTHRGQTEADGPEQPAGPADRPPASDSRDGPDRLMGLTPRALTELLGQPTLVRHEAMAQIWQYRQSACVFDIFLYEEANALRVAYFEARDHQAQKLLPEACYSDLRGRPGSG